MAVAEKVKAAVGKITRVVGVVVDVEFEKDNLPAIYNALEFESSGSTAGQRPNSVKARFKTIVESR